MDFFGNEEPKQKVAIVSSKDSFSVMGLKKKLQEGGLDGINVRPSVFQIEQAVEEDDPIVYYLDDDVYSVRGEDFLNELKNLCLEQNRLVILVGEKAEYEKAIEIIPRSAIVKWFSRPVDMDAFLNTVLSAVHGEFTPAKKRHILIVDDDATYMRMLHEWMKERYKVTMLDSGSQAIHWLMENKDVDLMLLDYEMPSMDGPAVLKMIREDPSTRDLPVMFLTGKNDREAVIKVVDLRPIDYVLKSSEKKMLITKLENFFEKDKQAE